MPVSVCPGCGVRSAEPGIPLDRPLNASPACWGLHAELVGYELGHLVPLGRYHQLTVDAYGAQHAGPPTGQIYVAYSLVGLHLALERGLDGVAVRSFHRRMGRPDASWPTFDPPSSPAALTVANVVAAGARADSPEGHARLVGQWAAAVWESWAERHDDVRTLAERLAPRAWDQDMLGAERRPHDAPGTRRPGGRAG